MATCVPGALRNQRIRAYRVSPSGHARTPTALRPGSANAAADDAGEVRANRAGAFAVARHVTRRQWAFVPITSGNAAHA